MRLVRTGYAVPVDNIDCIEKTRVTRRPPLDVLDKRPDVDKPCQKMI